METDLNDILEEGGADHVVILTLKTLFKASNTSELILQMILVVRYM